MLEESESKNWQINMVAYWLVSFCETCDFVTQASRDKNNDLVAWRKPMASNRVITEGCHATNTLCF